VPAGRYDLGVARNSNNSESRKTSSRVTKAPVQRAQPTKTHYQQQQDRKRLWLQIMCGLLVLAMLLPVLAFLFV